MSARPCRLFSTVTVTHALSVPRRHSCRRLVGRHEHANSDGGFSTLALLAVLVLLTGSLHRAQAQLGGGSITGSTLDPTGAVIAGAKVQAINTGANTTLETVTNQEGH